ncbi:hypothetical protein [Laspinema olomoucense]|uniref:hypothetical protein n=1 Tax=Laspinema olomoucense TaxID=3231600 RepID=UPI0021BB5442|nr:hypothetical protein [Laspinema sp. D3d]
MTERADQEAHQTLKLVPSQLMTSAPQSQVKTRLRAIAQPISQPRCLKDLP